MTDNLGIFGWVLKRFYIWWAKAIEVAVEIDEKMMRILQDFRERHGGTNEQALKTLAYLGAKFTKETGIDVEKIDIEKHSKIVDRILRQRPDGVFDDGSK